MVAETESVRLADALRVGEFRALWAAETISVAGDQLARVALALLVYGRTSSAILSALTYALTFLPAFLGGMFLSGLADRFPRRGVIITTDLLRAGLAAAMAIPGLPLGVLWALVGVLTLGAAPFKAAQLSLLPQVLPGSRYTAGLALRQMSTQFAQIIGFLAGGGLVAAFTAQGTLLFNSGTFLLSAVLVVLWVRPRPVPRPADEAEDQKPLMAASALNPRLAPVFVLACLVGLWVVPEGLAAPYAHELGATSFAVGLLMAADPVGSVLGAWLATKVVREPTLDSLLWPAALAGLPLVACFAHPGVWGSAGLWALSGVVSTIFLVRLMPHIAATVPDERRGTVMGRLSTCLQTSQGLAILGGGVLAERVNSFVAVAAAGGLSVLMVAVTALIWGRARLRGGDEQRQDESSQMSLLPTATSWERLNPGDPTPGGDGAGSGHGSLPSMDVEPGPTQPPQRGQTGGLLSKPRSAVVYISAACIVSVALGLGSLATQTVTRADLVMLLVIVGLGVVAAEVSRRVERMRRMITDAPHVNLSSVWTLSAAIVLPSGLASVLVAILYGHLWFRSWRQLPGFRPFRAVFNASNVVLCCQATAWISHEIRLQPINLAEPWTTLALFLIVIAAYFTLNSAFAATAIALLQSDRSIVRLLGKLSENILELATLCMGALAVVLLTVAAPLIALVYLPLYALHRSVLVRHFEHAAMSDSTTDLLNATSWQTLASKEVDRARRDTTTAGLLLVKINNVFKDGEEELRDRALRAVADTLRSETRSYDLCGRFGGEEFVVLLPGVDGTRVVGVADRIRQAVRTCEVEGLSILSVTIGVAEFPETSDQLSELLVAGSNALFAAGPDQVRVVEKF
jgi:diguanylate cyclase (GGDEF)-like protein